MAATAFLFGKLPAHGDFVARGMTPAQHAAWDSRCTAAIEDARTRLGDALYAALEATPPRVAMLPPNPEEPFWQTVCVAPSCDVAGRGFLFVVGIADPVGWGGGVPGLLAAMLESAARIAVAERGTADEILALAAAAPGHGGDDAVQPPRMALGWDDGWIGATMPRWMAA